jgi:hypothetical protein
VAGPFDGVLLDNDALSLLAAAGRLEDALALYGLEVAQAHRLPSVSYMLRRKKIGTSWTDAARERATRDSAAIHVWDHVPDADLTERLTGEVGIDPGEALYFASLAERPELAMMTGDRRALMALATAPDLRDVRERIAGRILCFEEILDALVEAHGARSIGESFAACRGHQTLMVAFTEVSMANDATCRSYIAVYHRELTVACGPGFLFVRDVSTTDLG